MTTEMEKLTFPEQIIPDVLHRVVRADNEVNYHTVVMGNLEWG